MYLNNNVKYKQNLYTIVLELVIGFTCKFERIAHMEIGIETHIAQIHYHKNLEGKAMRSSLADDNSSQF